jgi:hypothetical protein
MPPIIIDRNFNPNDKINVIGIVVTGVIGTAALLVAYASFRYIRGGRQQPSDIHVQGVPLNRLRETNNPNAREQARLGRAQRERRFSIP